MLYLQYLYLHNIYLCVNQIVKNLFVNYSTLAKNIFDER